MAIFREGQGRRELRASRTALACRAATLLIVFGMGGCPAQVEKASERHFAMSCEEEKDVLAILEELNEARAIRDAALRQPGVKDNGELSGRVVSLENDLSSRGCPVIWRDGSYLFQ